jgi:hypothetical protein
MYKVWAEDQWTEHEFEFEPLQVTLTQLKAFAEILIKCNDCREVRIYRTYSDKLDDVIYVRRK